MRLLVEDQNKVARFIHRGLEEKGYAVDVAGSGEDALAMADVTCYDLVILDLMLPGIDGLDVSRQLRRSKSSVPILMLTARDSIGDGASCLDLGADVYLTKPFAFAELLARIRAPLRRQEEIRGEDLVVADLHLNPATHEIVRGDRRIDLTSKEYQVLGFLMPGGAGGDPHHDPGGRLGL